MAMTCPSQFLSGQSHDILCSINTTDILTAGCFAKPTTVLFEIDPVNGTASTLCSTPYPGDSSCISGSVAADGECGCTGTSGDVETFTFKWMGRISDNGAKLACKVCAAMPPIVIPANDCNPMVVGEYRVSSSSSSCLYQSSCVAGVVIVRGVVVTLNIVCE